MDRPKKGVHDLINTLHDKLPATRNDVELMKKASALVGLEVSTPLINPTCQQLESYCDDLETREFGDSNSFFLTVICHGLEEASRHSAHSRIYRLSELSFN
jgi:hypothetical protein